MKHPIDPTIDCVFKALLGSQENLNLLIHFLNSVLRPDSPIASAEILNPYNEREFASDKLTVVDVKARDQANTLYQIEIQLAVFPYLPARMLYTWSDLYQSQLKSGEDFQQLCPVVAIWLLAENLLRDSGAFHHRFQLYDERQRYRLTDHCAIHLLELKKLESPPPRLDGEEQWLLFFKEAKHWLELPEPLNTPELRQAMETLKRFSEKERAYHRYQARQNAIREERSRQRLLEEALQQKEEALQQKEEALQQKEEALKREEHLLELLKKAGIDPNQ